MDQSLAIVIPALNEAETIGEVVVSAKSFGTVIVVDDGSNDGTADAASQAGARVVKHRTNRGYDAALESGFATADQMGFQAVVTMDADGEHDPKILNDFARKLKEIPLILGVRPQKQRIAEVVMGWIMDRRFGIADILCGMKGYWIELYRENDGFDHLESIGTELALNSVRRGHAFAQVPVGGHRRIGQPRFGSALRGNFRIFRALWRVLRSRA